ncbi:ferredoxin reductase family protein [Vibrio agarivorans]|uniref:Ferric reductase-like transmembrane domain-containing protein n=1 Tax=Vibrio agarivorans TaxID=153622 RepID=A0ABT7XZK6_9VIBR|nr:ferric reductase-like transmembrane domain-containing protein [Vibrio agarivorans]MDN2481201.1 ferric reductase-like transmembrane domain-containing protein [Vibrio agarivorans]
MLKITILLTLLWLPSVLLDTDNLGHFFSWRHQFVMYTGFLSLGYMSIGVLLAARFKPVESWVQGLDKGYQLHKSLGIAALASLTFHWLAVHVPKWLVGAGLLARPQRGGQHRQVIDGIPWRGIAEQIGELTFYVFIIFAVFSLVQTIGYRQFKLTHKIGGVLMVAGVFHSVILLDWSVGTIPMNLVTGVLSVIAVYCSYLSLAGKIGQTRKSRGQVTSKVVYSNKQGIDEVVRFSIRLQQSLNYKEGQFAYLDFKDGEPPHPFSILSYDSKSNTMGFGIKALGDYTTKLINNVHRGQEVIVEGGYGHFQIESTYEQFWVGAGIGIVPFVSRLYCLQQIRKLSHNKNEPPKRVHLFYCVNNKKDAYFEAEILSILQRLDFVELQILYADEGDLLSAETLLKYQDARSMHVSFCGPETFREQLKYDLMQAGMPESHMHFESFKMR